MPNNQISNLARFAGPYVKSSDSTAGARSEGTFIRHALVGLVCTLGFLRVARAMWAWDDLGHGIVCEIRRGEGFVSRPMKILLKASSSHPSVAAGAARPPSRTAAASGWRGPSPSFPEEFQSARNDRDR